ncbi:MAG: hypothetical protein ACOCQD_00120 [archaeon]
MKENDLRQELKEVKSKINEIEKYINNISGNENLLDDMSKEILYDSLDRLQIPIDEFLVVSSDISERVTQLKSVEIQEKNKVYKDLENNRYTEKYLNDNYNFMQNEFLRQFIEYSDKNNIILKSYDFDKEQLKIIKYLFGNYQDMMNNYGTKEYILLHDIKKYYELTNKVPYQSDTRIDLFIDGKSINPFRYNYTTYVSYFGKWTTAIKKAGFTPNDLGKQADGYKKCDVCGLDKPAKEVRFNKSNLKFCEKCMKIELFDKILVARYLGISDNTITKLQNKKISHQCDIYDNEIGFTIVDTENREINVEFKTGNQETAWYFNYNKLIKNSPDMIVMIALNEDMSNIENIWWFNMHFDRKVIDELKSYGKKSFKLRYSRSVFYDKLLDSDKFNEIYHNLEFATVDEIRNHHLKK